MKIQIKLMAGLRSRLPAAAQGGKAQIDVEDGLAIDGLLEKLGIRAGQVHLVMVNGSMEPERGRLLAEGDEVAVFPPMAGG